MAIFKFFDVVPEERPPNDSDWREYIDSEERHSFSDIGLVSRFLVQQLEFDPSITTRCPTTSKTEILLTAQELKEYYQLLRAKSPDLYLLMYIGLKTGIRIKDIFKLKWGDIIKTKEGIRLIPEDKSVVTVDLKKDTFTEYDYNYFMKIKKDISGKSNDKIMNKSISWYKGKM